MAITDVQTEERESTYVIKRDGPLKMRICRLELSPTVCHRRCQDLQSVYTLCKELGRGQSGVIRLCKHIVTGEKFACKSIAKEGMTQQHMEDVEREVQIMESLAGEDNIVQLKEVYDDKHSIHLVMELCVGGELVRKRGHYSEREAKSLCRKIVEGVQTCHLAGVMHRDLKLENILLASKEEDSPIKIIDFGLSVQLLKQDQVFKQVVGSPAYMAPEVYRRNYSKEADLWSAGVILYVLLCGMYPFRSSDGMMGVDRMMGVRDAVLHKDIDFVCSPWPEISNGAKDLVQKMLQRDPRRRLTAHEVLSHPWIREGA